MHLNVAENMYAANYNYSETILTSAQILALFTTPVVLVPAPGAGFVTTVLSVMTSYRFGSVAYLNGGTGNVQIVQGATVIVVAANLTANLLVGASQIKLYDLIDNTTLAANAAVSINKLTANLTAGNGTLKIGVWYATLPV